MATVLSGPPLWSPPAEFEEYVLVRLLGRGTMGQVYLARDRLLDRLVAVKFIAAVEPSPVSRERFQVEARALARLQHPNVVAIFRVGEVDGRPFLVSEYLRGMPLRALDRPVPCERVLEIGIALARGLAAAHRQGILHRDLKPANAFICEDGTTKLLDFGLAKLLDTPGRTPAAPTAALLVHPPGVSRLPALRGASDDPAATATAEAVPLAPARELSDPERTGEETPVEAKAQRLTRTGALLGSPLYLAPEIWRGATASPRSDVFSLGVILFELCVGKAPLEDSPRENLPRAAQERPAPPLASVAPGIDARLCQVIDRCLRLDPSERFESGDMVCEALEQIARPVFAAPVVAPLRVQAEAKKTVSSKRWRVTLAAILAVPVGIWGAMLIQGLEPEFAALRRALRARTAILYIDSEPSGATVMIDGQVLGQTPLVLDNDFPAVESPVQLVLRGFRPWSGTFRGGQDSRIQAKLKR